MNNTIDQIIDTAFSKLKTMADADTIVGKPILADNGTILLPVSKLSVGFVAGGGEYSEITLAGKKPVHEDFPFAGGSGAGLSISPIAFITIGNDETKFFVLDQKTPMEKLADMIPDVVKSALEKIGVSAKKTQTFNSTTVVEEQGK